MRCQACRHDVPAGRHCVRCGFPAEAEGGRQGFAASPTERTLTPWLVSTLFPHLPRASLRTFWIGLWGGLAGVVALAALGLFPIALLVAAALVPALLLLYVYDVDLYEDQPVRIVGLTVVWGGLAGAALGLVDQLLSPSGAGLVVQAGETQVLVRGFLLPLVGVALALGGPLMLLPYRRFNDVLDGVTFGVASAVTFVAAQALVASWTVFQEGLRPTGEPWPWVVRVLEHGVLLPVLAAGAAAGLCGSLWLRWRAPAQDRHALGLLGHPLVAAVLAGAAAVLGALAQLVFTPIGGLFALAVLALAALVWMRRVIHVGLLQEAAEVEVGPDVTCANCGEATAQHSFCVDCGISLLALPKSRATGERGTADVAIAPGTLLALSAAVLVATVGLTAAGVAVAAPTSPKPPCSEENLCGPEASSPIAAPEPWSSALGFRFEYDASQWRVVKESTNVVTLEGSVDQIVTIRARRDATPAELFAERLSALERRYPDLEEQEELARRILGPSIGYRDGLGAAYCGTLTLSQGWNARADVVVLAARSGRLGVAVTLVSDSCGSSPTDTLFVQTDALLNSFEWTAAP